MGQGGSRTYTPFTSSINNPVAQYQSACPTHKVSTAELLNNIGIGISAVGADKTHSKIWTECLLQRFL